MQRRIVLTPAIESFLCAKPSSSLIAYTVLWVVGR